PPGIGRLEIVDAARVVAGPVRFPQVVDELLACGIDPVYRYPIAGKGRTGYRRGGRVELRGERIEDGSQRALRCEGVRKVAGALQIGRNRRNIRRGLRGFPLLVHEEVEYLVLFDRITE